MYAMKSLKYLAFSNGRYFTSSSSKFSPIFINMPALSPTMTEGTIVAWHKKEGEKIESGDMLCEVQTDKAVVAMETEEEGTLAKIFKTANSDTIQIGTLIGVMATSNEDWQKVAAEAKPDAVVDSLPTPKTQTQSSTKSVKPIVSPSGSTSMGPAVRMLLEQYAITAQEIPATGPHHQLLKGDVLAHVTAKGLSPVVASDRTVSKASEAVKAVGKSGTGNYVDLPLTGMRRSIAKRLTESKAGIPHVYTRAVFSLDAVNALRNKLKATGVKVSVNDFVIKACALALRLVPELNSVSSSSLACRRLDQVDICFAVATPAGLITPILTDADRAPLLQLAERAKQLALRARDGKLAPHEFQGGSFTISNLGMFGIREFTAIINPPQVAILAVGGGQSVTVLSPTTGLNSTGAFAAIQEATLTLSTDARFVDEMTAGVFLGHVTRMLQQNPAGLLMGVADTGAEEDSFDKLMLSTAFHAQQSQQTKPVKT